MGLPELTVKDWFANHKDWNAVYLPQLEQAGQGNANQRFGQPSFTELIRRIVLEANARDEMVHSYTDLLNGNGTPAQGNAATDQGSGNAAGNGTGAGADVDNKATDTNGATTGTGTKKDAGAGSAGEATKPKGATKPPERPKVPVGRPIDITMREITIDDVAWTIPKLDIPTSNEERLSAEDLDDWQWLGVMKVTSALYGTRMDTLLGGTTSRSSRTPLMFVMPVHNDWWSSENKSEHKATLDYSSSAYQARSQAFFSAEIGGSYAFCAASVAASHASASASSLTVKRTYMTGSWRVPRALISLRDCTTVSPHFVDAARAALNSPPDQRYAALTRLFEDFGHVYYPRVVLGGMAYFQTSRVGSASSTEEQMRTTLAAAVDYKTPDGAGGGAKAEMQLEDGSKETAKQLAETVSWTMIGGRSELNGDVARWLTTVNHAGRWQLVDREGERVSTLSLLPPDLQMAIREAWKEDLRKTWGVKHDSMLPSSVAYPHFRGRPVVLRTSAALEAAQQRLLRAQPEPAGDDDNSALAKAYPGRVKESEVGFPEQNHLYWRFVYAGSHSDGLPHYRIFSADGAYALTTVREGDGQRHIILVTVKAAAAGADRAALWMVRATDPGNRFQEQYSGEWMLQQVNSGRFIGRPEVWGNGKVRTVLRDISAGLQKGTMRPNGAGTSNLSVYSWRIYDPLDTSWQND